MKTASFKVPRQRLLDTIDSPADLKRLSEDDLPRLAQEIREELISVLSRTGGNLRPNLRLVELGIAFRRLFEAPTG